MIYVLYAGIATVMSVADHRMGTTHLSMYGGLFFLSQIAAYFMTKDGREQKD